MRFLLDNSLAPRHARALDELVKPQHSFTHVRQKFGRAPSDADWMLQLRQEGDWVVLSGDCRVATNPHERAAWQQSGLTVFFLNKAWMHLPPIQRQAKLTAVLGELLEHAGSAPSGAGSLIRANGRFTRLYP